MSKRSKTKSIRLIAGSWRGTRLPVLDHKGLRPTTDRVRETLFNWLMHDLPSAVVLDLFAGTGALGLECLSRGSHFVQFVECEPVVARALHENLERLSVSEDQAAIRNVAASDYLSAQPSRQFDLVFLDPPFQADLLSTATEQLEQGDWLSGSAVIYIEYDSKQDAPKIPGNWKISKSGKAGQSAFALYRRTA